VISQAKSVVDLSCADTLCRAFLSVWYLRKIMRKRGERNVMANEGRIARYLGAVTNCISRWVGVAIVGFGCGEISSFCKPLVTLVWPDIGSWSSILER
jgi:hypothetical protein